MISRLHLVPIVFIVGLVWLILLVVDGVAVKLARLPRLTAVVPDLQPIQRDIAAVRARFEGMMTGEGGIPGDLLHDMRFVARIRVEHGSAAFPHFSWDGVCGFEMKNAGFTGFARGLWASHIDKSDRRLVVAESAIDALSYAVLHGLKATRFVSLAGQVNPEQRELLEAAAKKLPEGGGCSRSTTTTPAWPLRRSSPRRCSPSDAPCARTCRPPPVRIGMTPCVHVPRGGRQPILQLRFRNHRSGCSFGQGGTKYGQRLGRQLCLLGTITQQDGEGTM